ncbi:transposase-like protein [Spirochaeta isovalerica]|uniref:Transposase-like protein n=1 Tax=Spirochaeta isovalerica TaxID=150 RepID=A0A841RG53_9SPIO|nr:transposase-like protein [Spirochaeta isovalerica]
MGKRIRYAQEVKERSVRMVFDHEKDYESRWTAIMSIVSNTGCTPESLRKWVKQSEIDQGLKDGLSSDDRVRIKELERENRELREANEILRKASAYFTQAELDRRKK